MMTVNIYPYKREALNKSFDVKLRPPYNLSPKDVDFDAEPVVHTCAGFVSGKTSYYQEKVNLLPGHNGTYTTIEVIKRDELMAVITQHGIISQIEAYRVRIIEQSKNP